MNFDTLSAVEYGNNDSLQEFLFENGLQHKLFQEVFMDGGVSVPVYPLIDAETDNLMIGFLLTKLSIKHFLACWV